MTFAAMMLVALAMDTLIGWPDWLYRRVGHPVTWLGRLIAALDNGLNTPGPLRRLRGGLCVVITIGAATLPAIWIQSLLSGVPGIVIGGVLAWPLVAARSMYTHVAEVARPLNAGNITGARKAVSMIVGRDPQRLDQAGVGRAALESLAENTSDGVIAPLFWGAVAGLPGIAAYKAINTMDSMIGYKTPRHADFGMVAARLDDLVNLVPARLTGVMFAVVSRRPGLALGVMRADAGKHRSPNAGWPEAAMAAAIGVRLSGPRIYGTEISDEPWVNETAPDPDPADLWAGLRLYLRSIGLAALILGGVALL